MRCLIRFRAALLAAFLALLLAVPAFSGVARVVTLTIAESATATEAVHIGAEFHYACVKFPAIMTGTTAKIQGSVDGGATWQDVYTDGGDQVIFTIQAGKLVCLSDFFSAIMGLERIRIVSGSAEDAARTLQLALKS